MFKPLQAAKMPKNTTVEKIAESLSYPIAVSPKIDGIRVIILDEVAVTRKLKRVPNLHISSCLNCVGYDGLDGEIMTTENTDKLGFRKTTSAVMSIKGSPEFFYNVFDHTYIDKPFWKRYKELRKVVRGLEHIKLVEHEIMENAYDLLEYEEEMLKAGYEGVIIRDLKGVYKYGRSTTQEGIIRKLTRTIREEGKVVGYEERMRNNNKATRDNLGRLKRSNHKENKQPRGDLGSLILESDRYEGQFRVGTGFSDAERASLWKRRKKLIGKLVTFEHRPYGNYNVPRFPVFIGFRED